MTSAIRGLVSKKKLRFQQDGFDLDLTYITDNIIAMGFPSSGTEASYRNPMPEVQRFFETRHAGVYKIYNLCSERSYDKSCFGGSCATYGFEDHNPPPLDLIQRCCKDIHDFLTADPKHVAAIHCKAGKGRTGLIVCCYLVYSGFCESATQALEMYARQRTSDGKGVTIPSQIRYTYYFTQLLRNPSFRPLTYRLRHIRFHTIPNFDVGGGCDPYFDIRRRRRDGTVVKVFDYRDRVKKIKNYMPRDKIADLPVNDFNILLHGDVRLVFWDWDRMGPPDKMFHLWINTSFIDNEYLCFAKEYIDGASSDKSCKHFEPEFKVEFFLDLVTEEMEETAGVEVADDSEPETDEEEAEGDE